MKLLPGDHAQAEALRIAEDHLKRMGWKFTPADVGTKAREVLDAMADRTAIEEKQT